MAELKVSEGINDFSWHVKVFIAHDIDTYDIDDTDPELDEIVALIYAD